MTKAKFTMRKQWYTCYQFCMVFCRWPFLFYRLGEWLLSMEGWEVGKKGHTSAEKEGWSPLVACLNIMACRTMVWTTSIYPSLCQCHLSLLMLFTTAIYSIPMSFCSLFTGALLWLRYPVIYYSFVHTLLRWFSWLVWDSFQHWMVGVVIHKFYPIHNYFIPYSEHI